MKERLQNVPLKPGVYLYKDTEGQIIYVGKAKLLRHRLRSYFQASENLHPKVRVMMKRVADFDYIVTNNEVEALILENNLIKSYQPRYNIQLRDDKTYPYLKITTAEKYPRIYITREEKDGVSKYFGPYPEVNSLRETVKLLTNIFPLRTCKNLKTKERPCLNYDMGKCLAPCNDLVTPEEYRLMVDSIIDFLSGNSGDIVKAKEREMQLAAANLEFEKAAQIRDQLNSIRKLQTEQKISFDSPYNLDLIVMHTGEKQNLFLVFKIRLGKIIGKDTYWLDRFLVEDVAEEMHIFFNRYYADNNDIPKEILVSLLPKETDLLKNWLQEKTAQAIDIRVPQRGNKRQVLDMAIDNVNLLWQEQEEREAKNLANLVQLSKVLGLEIVPKRIEAYDISHQAGEETVGSMVVFTEGVADKKNYRKFKIKNAQNDDYASLSEVIKRRFAALESGNAAFYPAPDLIIIDGGLGQVNTVYQVLQSLDMDIPVFSLAEKNEEIFRAGASKPIILPRHDDGLRLLQRLRDEAHRFALGYNRQLRSKKVKLSALDNIPGIGPKRKQSLLSHFGSVAKIREASVEELLRAPNIDVKSAHNVYNYFRGITN